MFAYNKLFRKCAIVKVGNLVKSALISLFLSVDDLTCFHAFFFRRNSRTVKHWRLCYFFFFFFNFIKSQIYYDIHLQYVITLISIIQLKKNAQCAHVTPNLVQWLISWQFQFNETLGCSIDIHVPRAIEWNFTVINLKPCDEHNYFYNYLIKKIFKS